ncbi:hypothetical protein JTB14_002753 [Gonioctena quinquepunctata]|nr:hypothetical protein JTB14_002753 [Gonioctena quinquepunctata]
MSYMLGTRMTELFSNVKYDTEKEHQMVWEPRVRKQVIAAGGDITDLEEFVKVIRSRCPGIQAAVIEGSDTKEINKFIDDQFKLVIFKGTLLVHQVTGSAHSINRLVMKSLSCFCSPNGCDHDNLGTLNYKLDNLL